MNLERLDAARAERLIEQLRFGVPPPECIRAFTVGREEQMRDLERSLNNHNAGTGAALLVRANYGAGKSHLLQVLRELALDAGYAVSHVIVNAQEGVRFNRMDTIFGAACKAIEVDHSGRRGVGTVFDAFAHTPGAQLDGDLRRARERISSSGKWDYSDYLKSPGIYVALRAWVKSDGQLAALIEDWLTNPQNFRGQRKLLYRMLIDGLRSRFRDPRAEWQFYAEEVFLFHTAGHLQAWNALADLDLIAKASGLRGLILLFDEFEDVIQNLNRRNLQQQAFLNLFRFFAGDRYPEMSYFAVTPDFVKKCKSELLNRGVYDFDYKFFDRLPFFQLDPINEDQFFELAKRIRIVHGTAYGWNSTGMVRDPDLRKIVGQLWAVASPDRVRRSIQGVVETLDNRLNQ